MPWSKQTLPSLYQSFMGDIEVGYHSCHHEVHGAEITNEAIHILPSYSQLQIQKVEEG